MTPSWGLLAGWSLPDGDGSGGSARPRFRFPLPHKSVPSHRLITTAPNCSTDLAAQLPSTLCFCPLALGSC